MPRSITQLFSGGSFFEGPRWHDGRWWLSDFYRGVVVSITTTGVETVVFDLGAEPSGLGWLPDGSLLLASMRERKLLRLSSASEASVHADLSAYGTTPINDMVVDGAGRAYVGSMATPFGGRSVAPSNLLRVDPDGCVEVAASNLVAPNGVVVTPDGQQLIVAESYGARLTAFDIGPDGMLSEPQLWAQLGPAPPLGDGPEMQRAMTVLPDGCCLDEDGYIWVADILGRRCLRVSRGGEIRDEVSVPPHVKAYACMLGGDDRRTLLICCAPDSHPETRVGKSDAVLLTTEVTVPGAGWP